MKKLFITFFTIIILCCTTLSFVGCSVPKGKVGVKYYDDGASVVAGLKAGVEEIGLIPEPAATMLEKTTTDTWYRLDVQQLYNGVTKAYPQAVLMVKSSLLNAYPQIVTQIQNKIEENVNWAKSNPEDAVNAIKSKFPSTTLKAPQLSVKAIDGCNIYFQSSQDAKQSVNKYIADIRAVASDSANVVGDDFFYQPSANASAEWSKEKITFYAPDGAPAISIAKFIKDGQNLGTDKTVEYSVVQAGAIVGNMSLANADIILMPLNGATKKYNQDANVLDPYKLVSVITHGNFYIMSKTPLTLNDLIDKRVAVPNKGAVPDWTFKTILKANNLQPVVVA